jgi:hypothetical protein
VTEHTANERFDEDIVAVEYRDAPSRQTTKRLSTRRARSRSPRTSRPPAPRSTDSRVGTTGASSRRCWRSTRPSAHRTAGS